MKKLILAGLISCICIGAGAQYISNWSGTYSNVSVTTISAQVIAANANRRSLFLQNVGANTITCVNGTTAAVSGLGIVLDPSSSGAGHQGGSLLLNNTTARDAYQCITNASTSSLTIVEGN